MLEEWKPHVLHYAGHGAFPDLDDPAGDLSAPSLVLEGKHAPGIGLNHVYEQNTVPQQREVTGAIRELLDEPA